MRVFRAESAAVDLDSIADFFGSRNPVATLELLDRIAATEALLADHPRVGHGGRVSGTRELVVTGTPFVIVYTATDEAVTVLRVLHSRQKWPQA